MSQNYQHVSYLWEDSKAASLSGNEVDLFIYRSNILGADLRITNYGGGNTSVKIKDKDPLTGQETEVMWIKGSGGDIGTLTKSGCAALYLERLRNLENVYRGIEFEDEMVELFNHCIYDLASKAPSIDTALHGFLPFKHIDHLHPDAAIAIAAAKDGKKITQELFSGTIGWVEWKKPGFELGLQLKQCLDENPGIKAKGKFVSERFAYLDDAVTTQKLIQFSSDTQTNVTFSLPQMHCSSCIFLLENQIGRAHV